MARTRVPPVEGTEAPYPNRRLALGVSQATQLRPLLANLPIQTDSARPRGAVRVMPASRSLSTLEATPHAVVFPDREPKTVRLQLAAGDEVGAHCHPDRNVLCYVIEGKLSLHLDSQTVELEAGDVVQFDGNHTIKPVGVTACTALIVLAPKQDV